MKEKRNKVEKILYILLSILVLLSFSELLYSIFSGEWSIWHAIKFLVMLFSFILYTIQHKK